MTEKAAKSLTRVLLGPCILSYPHFVKAQDPQPGSTGPAKFSGAFVFPKGSDLAAAQAAVIAAAQAAYPGKDVKAMLTPDSNGNRQLRSPFRLDGADKGYPEGAVFINARATQRPGLVLADLTPVVSMEEIESKFYAGAWVKVSLTAFAYNNSGNRGVSFGLNNVQFIRDGDRLDSRIAPDAEFTADMTQAPASLESLGIMG